MKRSNFIKIFFLVFIFSSCTMQKRLYRPGFYIDHRTNNLSMEIPEPEGRSIPVENKGIPVQKECLKQKGSLMFHLGCDSIPAKVDSSKIVTLSPAVGKIIDKDEKIKYHLFPFFKTDDFVCAYFIQEKDGSLYLIGKLRDGTEKRVPYTVQQFQDTQMNNFNDTEVAKLKGVSIGDESGTCKRSAGAVIAAFPLSALALLFFVTSFSFFLPILLFLIGLILAITGTSNANRILRRHNAENKLNGKKESGDFIGRSEAVFASRAGEVYFILLGLFVLFIAWFILSWIGVI